MSRRSPCLARHLGLLAVICALLFLSSPSSSQSQSQTLPETTPTFKSAVQMVLVDVVVTNGSDAPVTGLTRDQFHVFEDGKPQTIASFEEHAGIPDVPALSKMAKLPPDVFSNAPLVKTGDSANILLLDSLNTQMEDQSYVHSQMIKYLKKVRPGARVAIFTLSDRLRFVQGFTADPALLMAAMNGKKSGGNPELSPLLQTSSERIANQQAVGQMRAIGDTTASASVQAAASSLARFLAENTSSQTGVRASLTLEAIKQLAVYLEAIPGRKNVIWFTGSFPLNTLAAGSNIPMRDRDFGPEVAKTANLLASARIAIYPVEATGLAPPGLDDASTPSPADGIAGGRAGQTMTQTQVRSLDRESTERAQNSASMEQLADNTGGQFFINTNGFDEVLDRVVKTGTYYYTLAYSPTNRNMDGQPRHIQIRLSDGKYHLAYRRGYYATNDFMMPVLEAATNGDPLRPLMDHGTPDATGILYTMKVVPAAAQPRTLESGAAAHRAGDNGKLVGAVTRYTVTFAIPPENLALDTSPDGVHHGSLEVTLLAYDRDGIPMNWMVRMVQVRVPPDRYRQAQANGVGFNLDIDVPPSGMYLRSGMFDKERNKAGTMEIPLGAVIPLPAAVASKTPQGGEAPALLPAAAPPAGPAPSTWPSSAASPPKVFPGPNSPATLALRPAPELEVSDVPEYCSHLALSQEHASSLASVCEFVLNVRKNLSNIICDRQTKRYWTAPSTLAGTENGAEDYRRSDVVTVNVTYREGQEFYSDVRVDGKPVEGKASEISGSWSHGEFATLLTGIFAPSSKTEFHYSKQIKLHSISALLFNFTVAAENNRLYFLESGDKIWFPEYKGEIWIDAETSSLLRLELETAYMPDDPIRLTKDEIEYSNLRLGDGTRMVLPTNSKALICGQRDNCSHSVTKFTNWHKFRATTNILARPGN